MSKIISLIAVVALFLISCGNNNQGAGAAGPQALPFPVIEVPTEDVTGIAQYPVSIEGVVSSEVRAKISGYITRVAVNEGDRVRKGQLLFKIETNSLTEEADAAKANIQAAQVSVDQLKPLVDQGIVSQMQLETAKAKLAQTKASYESIVANINYSNIVSPVNGIVGSIPYRLGSLVDPSSPKPLTTVAQTDQVYGYFSMNEVDYLNFLLTTPGKTLEEKLKHFPSVKLQLANGEDFKHEGTITAVTGQVDPTAGTVNFRATFSNPEHLVANGSSGKILIPTYFKDAVVVPKESTYEMQGNVYVYKLLPDSTVTSAIIDVKSEVNNMYVAGSGIEANQKIIAQGAGRLQESQKVIPNLITVDSLNNNLKQVFQ